MAFSIFLGSLFTAVLINQRDDVANGVKNLKKRFF